MSSVLITGSNRGLGLEWVRQAGTGLTPFLHSCQAKIGYYRRGN